MSTSSVLPAGSAATIFTVEEAMSLLISRFGLDETETNKLSEGKDRLELSSSDADFALRMQAEDLVNTVQIIEDARYARRLEESRSDHGDLVSGLHHWEIALGLLNEGGLSVPSCGRPTEPLPSPDSRFKIGLTEADALQSAEKCVCVVCDDVVDDNEPILQAPCDHYYCRDCTISLVNACTSDELLYPPKCCNQPIPHEIILPCLDDTLRSDYSSKQLEFAVPVTQRIYCPTPDCPTFITSSGGVSGDVVCYRCSSSVCSMCKQFAHSGDCPNDPGILQIRALARSLQWQTCPNCLAVIERIGGCDHMVCRCASQFCYACGHQSRSCKC